MLDYVLYVAFYFGWMFFVFHFFSHHLSSHFHDRSSYSEVRPFSWIMFFNIWLEHPGFVELLGEWRRKFHVAGWKSFVFKEKLNLLKAKISVWQ